MSQQRGDGKASRPSRQARACEPIITAKLKLITEPEQFATLRQTQLACSVERQVAATYKGLWTKLKKNAEHRRKKITKKRFKGLDKPPQYRSPTVQYTYERDYTFQCHQQVSTGTLGGRISIPYQGKDSHIALIQAGATIGDAKLWYDRQKKTFYLLVSLSIDVAEPTCEQFTEVVGVDVGIR